MKKFKAAFTCLLLLCFMSTNVFALSMPTINQGVRISEQKSDNNTVFTLSKTEPVTLKSRSLSNQGDSEQLYCTKSVKIFAKDEIEADAVRAQLSYVEYDFDYPEGTYFGGSLTMYVNVYFNKKTVSGKEGTFYKLVRATGYATVRNGTTLVSKELAFTENGPSDVNSYFTDTSRFNVTSQTNISKYAPTSWPFVTPGSAGHVGVSLTCKVTRPSGETKDEIHTVAFPQTMN